MNRIDIFINNNYMDVWYVCLYYIGVEKIIGCIGEREEQWNQKRRHRHERKVKEI